MRSSHWIFAKDKVKVLDTFARKKEEVKIDSVLDFLNKKYHTTSVQKPLVPGHVYIRASSVADLCPRLEFLRAKYDIAIQQKLGLMDNMRFTYGTNLHLWLQNEVFREILYGRWECQKCGKIYGSVLEQVRIPGECVCGAGEEKFSFLELAYKDEFLHFGGHTDGSMMFGGELTPVDFKSINMEGYQGLDKWGVSDRYIWQGNGYMMLAKSKRVRFIYVNKNGPEFREKIIEEELEIQAEIKKRCLETVKAVDSLATDYAVLPERRICEVNTCSRARNCPMRKECFELPEKETILKKMEVL